MSTLFLEYPKCSTCKKAKKFLEDNNIEFIDRDIVTNNPTVDELKEWISKSRLAINKFFNTSGMLYREKGLSQKLPSMSYEEKLKELSSNGMLVKRPLLITDTGVLVGFKEAEWLELK